MTQHHTHYQEPELSYLVLDFLKEAETRVCLESIKKYTKFNHKVIYLHNGNDATYPYALFTDGLIDHFIQTRENTGLGIGTRNLFAAAFSPWSFYMQNDQRLKRDFTQGEFENIQRLFGTKFKSPEDDFPWTVMSVCLAGGFAGTHIYSERAHIAQTSFYKELEVAGILGFHGAGPWHAGPWREKQIQEFYKQKHFLHYTYSQVLVEDCGGRSIRENKDGSLWEGDLDTHMIRLLRGPVMEKAEFPPLSDTEWNKVLETHSWPQSWPEWKKPGQ